MPGSSSLRQVRQNLPDDRGKLETMPRAWRRNNDLRVLRQEVEDELRVRGVRKHAGPQGHSATIGRREIARRGLSQRRFVTGTSLAVETVGIDALLEVMVKTDLEARHVVLGEAVETALGHHQVEDREAFWREQCPL